MFIYSCSCSSSLLSVIERCAVSFADLSGVRGGMASVSEGLRQQVREILDSAWEGGAIVAAWEQIKQILLDNNLAWEQQIQPEHAATHKSNRSGKGVGTIQSHSHGYDIVQQGFSWHKASDAVAVEDVGCPVQKAFIEMLTSLSDGMFPSLLHIIALSISASHTNAWLRSVKAGCKSGCPDMADTNGNLNMEEICLNRPELKTKNH